MTILVPLLLLALILAAAAVWTLTRKEEKPPGPPDAGPLPAEGGEKREVNRFASGTGPPSAGQGLDALKARLSDMPTESLQDMLDMGATLKPGAEDLIKNELDRRQESE